MVKLAKENLSLHTVTPFDDQIPLLIAPALSVAVCGRLADFETGRRMAPGHRVYLLIIIN